jgi:hypothetical protein
VISYQAKQVWRKFGAWYGADVIERKFGVGIPDDWAEVIDTIEKGKLDGVLADVRVKHPTWPPGLPEFEQIAKAANRPAFHNGPSVQEQLRDYVLRAKRLTPAQLRAPWRDIYTGNGRTGEGLVVTGVVVPPDGDAPGYRVMVIDMQSEAA